PKCRGWAPPGRRKKAVWCATRLRRPPNVVVTFEDPVNIFGESARGAGRPGRRGGPRGVVHPEGAGGASAPAPGAPPPRASAIAASCLARRRRLVATPSRLPFGGAARLTPPAFSSLSSG